MTREDKALITKYLNKGDAYYGNGVSVLGHVVYSTTSTPNNNRLIHFFACREIVRCGDCPLSSYKNGVNIDCSEFRRHHPLEAMDILVNKMGKVGLVDSVIDKLKGREIS